MTIKKLKETAKYGSDLLGCAGSESELKKAFEKNIKALTPGAVLDYLPLCKVAEEIEDNKTPQSRFFW